nr:SDR family oxidoreductase [Thermoproteota archaeon]
MVNTILVTGATGTVGSEVIKQLISSPPTSNFNIKAAVHSQESAKRVAAESRVKPVQIDYNKPDTIAEAFKDVDRLFLLTPFQSNMVELSSNLVNVAKKIGVVKHIVKLSVMGADADPGITGGRLHRQAENIIEESGISYTFLRPNFFMQNFVTFFSQTIKEQGAFYVPADDGKVSFVDVRDIAGVAVQALLNESNHGRKAYNITGPNAISYAEAAEILSNEIGRKIKYVDISEDQAREGMKAIGMDEWFINSMMELFRI